MDKPIPPIALPLQHKLIVSCQAPDGDVFHDPGAMARFAVAALQGGAAGIRANGAADIRSIHAAVPVPVLGIQKALQEDGRILITPSVEGAGELVEAGASMIALDCTARGRRFGALERLRRIRDELGVPVLADIATLEEAIAAEASGADFVLSTMHGYTPETEHVKEFEPAFIAALVRGVKIPLIAEGRIKTPEQARAALEAGAFAVVVGGAITSPQRITRRFAAALDGYTKAPATGAFYIGIDMGGTNTKAGIVAANGDLRAEFSEPTPFAAGRDALLAHLVRVAKQAAERARRLDIPLAGLGIATAGWVDPDTGRVVYATENLPGWTGAPIAETLAGETGIAVTVENDANAVAIAEKHFGAARESANFVCLTLGTGVGGGCYIGGHLQRGAHFFANALGHICIQPDGLPCTCGQRGCLEVYTNAAALIRYAGADAFSSAEQVIQAAGAGDTRACRAVSVYAHYLAIGCASIIHLLDPEMLILTGGLAQDNAGLLSSLAEELAKRVAVWPQRHLQLRISPLGYYSGVLGAAACAMERRENRGVMTPRIPTGGHGPARPHRFRPFVGWRSGGAAPR